MDKLPKPFTCPGAVAKVDRDQYKGGAGVSVESRTETGTNPMKLPMTWLTIVSYRDFYDIPRLILASDREQQFWVLDSAFDEDQDEYSTSYSIYFAGDDFGQAREKLECLALGGFLDASQVLPISSFEFDRTNRVKLRLINPAED